MKFATNVIKYTNRCKDNQLLKSRRLFATTASESIASEYKPMATALSDFLSPSSFESDDHYHHHSIKTTTTTTTSYDERMEYKPMATAISDILSPTEFEQTQLDSLNESSRPNWSSCLSFASPEADFVSASFESVMSKGKIENVDDEDMMDVEILKGVVGVRNQEANLNLHHDIFDVSIFTHLLFIYFVEHIKYGHFLLFKGMILT